MLSTTDRFSCSLQVDGYDVEGNLSKLLISTNYKHKLPALELVFTTFDSSLRNIIQDASQLTLVYSDGFAGSVTKVFRSVSHKMYQSGPMDYHRFIGVLDCIPYLAGCSTESFKGSSSDLFTWMMGKLKLPSKTDQTYDQQTWISSGKRYADWMYRVSQAGYINDKSLMMLLPGFDGVMRYINISDIDYTNARSMAVVGYKPSSDDPNYEIPIISWGSRTISGKTNNSLNYNTKLQIQDVTKTNGLGATAQKVQVTKSTERLSVNKDVQASLANNPRPIYSTPQTGNNHANYTTAIFQNTKLLALNGVVTSVMTNTINSLVDLGSPVDLTVTKMNSSGVAEVDIPSSGKYWIAGKVAFVGPDGMYLEKYEMQRGGNNVSTVGES